MACLHPEALLAGATWAALREPGEVHRLFPGVLPDSAAAPIGALMDQGLAALGRWVEASAAEGGNSGLAPGF